MTSARDAKRNTGIDRRAHMALFNGTFGKRVVRFETGRLAQQAQGAVAAYLDEDTMILSATSAGKHPRDGFDFVSRSAGVRDAAPTLR